MKRNEMWFGLLCYAMLLLALHIQHTVTVSVVVAVVDGAKKISLSLNIFIIVFFLLNSDCKSEQSSDDEEK